MTEEIKRVKSIVAPWSRVIIIIVAILSLCIISRILVGSVVPTDSKDALIFQNALLLIVLGSSLLEYKFTKPADSMVNGLMGVVTLITVYGKAPTVAWWIIFLYCIIVFVMAGTCIAVSSGKNIIGYQKTLANLTYKPSVVLGKGRVLYSIVFLFGVFSFYSLQSIQTLVLTLFWGIYVALWPLGLPELLSGLRKRSSVLNSSGKVIRTEAPNIIWAILESDTDWSSGSIKLYQQSDGEQYYVVPLFSQEHGDNIVGAGLCAEKVTNTQSNLLNGLLYDIEVAKTGEEIATMLGGEEGSKLVGFVVENSTIEAITFQTIDSTCCKEGMTVWCNLRESKIYYQITEGLTKEEVLEHNRHGFQVAIASQLGSLDTDRGFIKYEWLPAMNSPIFAVSESFGNSNPIVKDQDFVYGEIPGTSLKVGGAFTDMIEYHTAILGVTGSGKTELAFDMIRHAVDANTKVICVDLTQKYQGRLADLTPQNLSISGQLSAELGEKLFDVETGMYGAGDEKKALEGFSNKLRTEIGAKVKDFIESEEEDHRLGIITLNEISNTKATIYITEIFLTCILHYARDYTECPRILIVLEEAHTVVPEASTMGLGDFNSKGLVSKIAQIALQGRKYEVGLLVIAQRTATVSKTILTQCNTIITFSCFDATSLDFLKNVMGERHTRLIPNLPFLQAVVFGKGIRSERPIVIQVPFDKSKEDAPSA